MERKRVVKRKLVKKRRLKWSRLLLVAVFLMLTISAVCWSSIQLYNFGSNMYGQYQVFRDSLETKHSLKGRLADKRFAGYTNVLLLGIDDGNSEENDSSKNADTLIVASINNNTGMIRLLSIPGETLVHIPGRQNTDNVNKTYFYGEMQLTVRTVEEWLYFPIHHYVVVDTSAFKDFIDLLGGIDLYVEEDMNYEDAYSGFKINLKKGYQHLDGRAAEQYVRYRSDDLGVIGRVQRQQRFVKAINEKLIATDMVSKLPQLVELIKNKTVTSLAPLDAAQLLKNLYGFSTDKLKIEMLPGEFTTVNGRQHWQISEDNKQLLLDAYFPVIDEENKQE